MIGWLALGLLLVLVVALAVGARRMWVRQRAADEDAAWREAAAEIDHAYSTADAANELGGLDLPLLGRLDGDVVAPELTGPSEGGIQRLFIAEVDGRAVAVGVADLARPVPAVSLRPHGADGPEVGAGWDVVEAELTQVTARYEVRGLEPDAIREFLEGEIGGWLADEGAEWSIELAGSQVLVARSALPVDRIGEVAAMLDAFRSRLPWADARNGAGAAPGRPADADEPQPRKRRRRRRRRGRGGGGGGDGETDAPGREQSDP